MKMNLHPHSVDRISNKIAVICLPSCSSSRSSSPRSRPVLNQFVQTGCRLCVCFGGQRYGAWSERHITGKVHPLFYSVLCSSDLLIVPIVSQIMDLFSSSFLPAVNHLTSERLDAEKLNRRLERELRALRKQLGATLVLRGTIQE